MRRWWLRWRVRVAFLLVIVAAVLGQRWADMRFTRHVEHAIRATLVERCESGNEMRRRVNKLQDEVADLRAKLLYRSDTGPSRLKIPDCNVSSGLVPATPPKK